MDDKPDNVVSMFGKKKAAQKNRSRRSVQPGTGNIMCRSNHHKWVIDKQQEFDVRKGKLVTVERCSRCNKTRHRLS